MANLCTLRNGRLQDIAGLMYKVKNNICPNTLLTIPRGQTLNIY